MRLNNQSLILGITGGIGSGKSTVSTLLKEMGAAVIDADVLSREVVMPGEPALEELTAVFGKAILDDWGQLKRKALADVVFQDKTKLEVLNKIVHKYVAQRIKDNVKEQLEKMTKIIVIDAPIPINEGFLNLCHTVWTVHSDMETRILRVMKRSAMTYDEAISRIQSQIKDEEYLKIADTVIYNDKDISSLKEEVKYQLSKLLG